MTSATNSLEPVLTGICRYPVKGLSGEQLAEVCLEPGEPIAWDWAFAIENGGSEFDEANPQHLPKSRFLMLARHPKLAELKTRFDADTGLLTVFHKDRPVARGNLTEADGRRMLEQFFADFMENEKAGPPRIVGTKGHSFTDIPETHLSIINLASLRDIERLTGATIDPVRFRGNLLIDGLAPWQEFELVGKEIRIGNVTLFGVERITRCAATSINPETAEQNMAIPQTLFDGFGHRDCGIYAEISEGGKIRIGDRLQLV